MTDQIYLNNYFANHWGYKGVPVHTVTGIDLANQIKDDEYVLDVGCGRNLFKGIIKNLVGIDPAFDEADIKTTIEDFQTDDMFDVALCLGSVNFGDIVTIRTQIASILKYLKPQARIYWRCNPGFHDHGNTECEQIEFFPWSKQWHVTLSTEYGFELVDFGTESNRIYAEWKRL